MPGFAAAKEAGQPCPKLGHDGLCTIYADRAEQGFAGCLRFECFGAGQHVVQTLFEGRDWRDDRELLGPMIETFLAMRPVSDLAFLVSRALASGPDPDTTLRLEALQAELAGNSRVARDATRRGPHCEGPIRRHAGICRARSGRLAEFMNFRLAHALVGQRRKT